MKKAFLSHLFAPSFYIILWGALLAVVLLCFPAQKFQITTDGQIIDIVTYTGYALMILSILCLHKDFKGKMLEWGIYLFFAIAALLREAGIQHHLTTSDTTPFKSRFFLNPNNPISEKLIFGTVLLIIFGALI